MSDAPDPSPISVKPTVGPVVMSESTKAVMLAAFAVAAEHFVRSDLTLGVVLACGGFVTTFFFGLWHRIRCWGNLRFLASLPQVPDSVARVGK